MMLLKYFLSRFAALCATDFLFVFIGPSLLYYLLVFPFLSFRSLILSYLFRCALLSDPLFFCLASQVCCPLVPPFLISVFVYIRWRSQNALSSYHNLRFSLPPIRTSERKITCSGGTGARSAYYRPLLLLSLPVVDRRGHIAITSTSGFLFGKPLWGLRPLRGQCRDQWGSIWV